MNWSVLLRFGDDEMEKNMDEVLFFKSLKANERRELICAAARRELDDPDSVYAKSYQQRRKKALIESITDKISDQEAEELFSEYIGRKDRTGKKPIQLSSADQSNKTIETERAADTYQEEKTTENAQYLFNSMIDQ